MVDDDRRRDIERAALWYLIRSGLGNHFVKCGTEPHLTQEEIEDLTGFDFDPDRNALSRSVYEFAIDSVDELEDGEP